MGKICPETDTGTQTRFRQITSKLSERAIEFADQKMELGKILNLSLIHISEPTRPY